VRLEGEGDRKRREKGLAHSVEGEGDRKRREKGLAHSVERGTYALFSMAKGGREDLT
jgi:hypothetical protein